MNEPLFQFILQLADTRMVLAQRLTDWCGHAPEMETDIALSNIALDHLGAAASLYNYAASIEGKGRTEDDLCFLRTESEYLNPLLVELPNGAFSDTIARAFVFDTFNVLYLDKLTQSADATLAGIAKKAWMEAKYHLRFSQDWLLRLGDGTETSNRKMQEALDTIWKYTGELLIPTELETSMLTAGYAPDLQQLKTPFEDHLQNMIGLATLQIPQANWYQSGGKQGKHTEYMGRLLAEMQYLQRTYPGLNW